VGKSADLFNRHQELIYSISLVPHPAFIDNSEGEPKGLSSSFKTKVLKVPAFRECFMDCYVKRILGIAPDAEFSALAAFVKDAFDCRVEHGYLERSRILGSIAHPSAGPGLQVDIFLAIKKADMLKAKDPVRNRIQNFTRNYDGLASEMSKPLRWPLPRAMVT
jgi:hypothetical protein